MTTAGVIRSILVIDIIAMALLAILYLRQRRMSWAAFCWWGLLALAVPVLGPFLVISNRPGSWNPDRDIRQDFRRITAFVHRLLARRPQAAGIYHATTRLERARMRRRQKQTR